MSFINLKSSRTFYDCPNMEKRGREVNIDLLCLPPIESSEHQF